MPELSDFMQRKLYKQWARVCRRAAFARDDYPNNWMAVVRESEAYKELSRLFDLYSPPNQTAIVQSIDNLTVSVIDPTKGPPLSAA